ncbi:hypothetical protein [Paracraurococcus lichenis]|uniref:Uncharacterized protein n=1 Tax=Paracraurococcus lichenis TaxID=3064888 RepID=A0ABT9E4P9_9PROT|nr:hypothetical protein [Paracraurococcus sp. LOR1-02]MDO9711131.1 hypothetical protein [Paracraurococcus sp. LOR1-02]
MPLSLLLASLALPVLPPEAALVLALAGALALLAAAGPAETPPSEDVTTAAIFAFHGHV